MLLLTIVSQGWVRPRYGAIAEGYGFHRNHARRRPPARGIRPTHKVSVSLEGTVLLVWDRRALLHDPQKPF